MLPTPRPGPSPFLEGTAIQFAWDSTSIGALKRCPRLYQLSILEGWVPNRGRVDLEFGIFYTEALEYYYKLRTIPKTDLTRLEIEARERGEFSPKLGDVLNHEQALTQVVYFTMARTLTWDSGESTQKNRFTLLRSIVWYLDDFQNDPATTVIAEDGTPLVERSIRMELDWGPVGWVPDPETKAAILAEGGTPNQPYILCAHLDRVVNFLGGTYVMDHKTTKMGLGEYYFDQYEPNNQMSCYTLLGKVVFHSPIRGVIIDAMQVAVGFSRSGRGITYRTDAQIAEWLGDLKVWFSLAESFARKGHWPMNDTACFNCAFNHHDSKICAKDPGVRESFLKSHFNKDKPWNPLLVRN